MEDFAGIAKILLSDLKKALSERHISFVYNDAVCDYVAEKSYSVKFGARNMRRFIQTEIEDKAAEQIVRLRGAVDAITCDVADGELVVNATRL